MFDILLMLVLGVCFGIVAGLIPGLHPNSTIPFIILLSGLFAPLSIAIFLVSMAIVNGFVAFVPSILLGAPESGNELSILPGHRLLLSGRAFEAVKLTVIGGLGAVCVAAATLPLFAITVPLIYKLLRPYIHWLLGAVVAYMILSEENIKKIAAAIAVFILSGALGIVVLDSLCVKDGLFPLLSGLFGLPILLVSIKTKTKLPESFSFDEEMLSRTTVWKAICSGAVAGIIAGLLPGIGSSTAATIVQNFQSKISEQVDCRKFLISIAAITGADIIYSLLALWLIGNPRSAIAVAVGELIQIDFGKMMILLTCIICSAAIGAYIALRLVRSFIFIIRRVNYSLLCTTVCIFILFLIALVSGFIGLFVAGIAVAVGLYANLTAVHRTHAMGCLILPTILWFAGLRL